MKSTLAIILSIIFLGCSGDPKDVLVDSPNAKDSISEICKDLSEKECNLSLGIFNHCFEGKICRY
ncbi:MAG: hypothetical protein ACI9N1_002775 [Flavobacteriales bacterium]|jgi:hypothetical protein